MDFSQFDNKINTEELNKAIEEAAKNPQKNNKEVPAGTYIVAVEKMELGATKDGRPMFKVMLRIKEGEFKKWCLFMNRTIYGTKNDANMISSVIGWLKTLEPSVDVEFKNYTQFADLILDIYEELTDAVELEVDYDPDEFNSVSVVNIYDLNVPF